MPPKKKRYGKRRGRYSKRRGGRRSGRSKLADGKINTLVERRIKDISKKEVQKALVWYNPYRLIAESGFVANGGAQWEAHGQYLRIPTASMLSMNAGTLWHARCTDFGEMILNQVDSAAINTQRANFVRCKYVKSRFEFANNSSTPTKIGIFMVAVTGSQLLAEEESVPNVDMAPFDFNGLNFNRRSEPRDETDYSYRILAKRQITVGASRIYTTARNRHWVKSQNDYTVGTTVGVDYNIDTHTENRKVVTLNKYFKGLGKRFQFTGDPGDYRARRTEIFLCMVADSVVHFTSHIACKIRLDKPVLAAQKMLPAP